ncbi:hypothetical protein R3P38DRAFT_3284125 [Favolaschia claudopus]|uniref:Uncharacterized protein n=1 Tax=Favolaschia claudopus TaxID=2862362 RepID=A0AAW0A4U8_9AGAR
MKILHTVIHRLQSLLSLAPARGGDPGMIRSYTIGASIVEFEDNGYIGNPGLYCRQRASCSGSTCTNFPLPIENAYGTVYGVHHKILNWTLALKIIRTVQDAEGNATNTYISEIGGGPKDFSVLQSLKHGHIPELASIFRLGTFRTIGIFTEYMAGRKPLDRDGRVTLPMAKN